MTDKEFFYLVASMREAQRDYYATRDRNILLKARALENDVDREIWRVTEIMRQRQQ